MTKFFKANWYIQISSFMKIKVYIKNAIKNKILAKQKRLFCKK